MALDIRDFIALIDIQIVSLSARREKAGNFSMNTAMHIEAELCEAQIEALEKERILYYNGLRQ